MTATEPHNVRFQFGSAVPQQAPSIHPVIKALAAGRITKSDAITQAPFLDWPADVLIKWQGTIAAIMQKATNNEGRTKTITPNRANSVNHAERRAAIESAIFAVLQDEPLSTADAALRANTTKSAAVNALARMRRDKRITQRGSGLYARWHVNTDSTEMQVMTYLREHPGATIRSISKALFLGKREAPNLLNGLCANGKIIEKRTTSPGGGWRKVFFVNGGGK